MRWVLRFFIILSPLPIPSYHILSAVHNGLLGLTSAYLFSMLRHPKMSRIFLYYPLQYIERTQIPSHFKLMFPHPRSIFIHSCPSIIHHLFNMSRIWQSSIMKGLLFGWEDDNKRNLISTKKVWWHNRLRGQTVGSVLDGMLGRCCPSSFKMSQFHFVKK